MGRNYQAIASGVVHMAAGLQASGSLAPGPGEQRGASEVTFPPCRQVAMEFYDKLFAAPLQPRELQALQRAAKVALLRPGDVYMFSGGVAHTVMCVSQALSVLKAAWPRIGDVPGSLRVLCELEPTACGALPAYSRLGRPQV